MILITEDIFSKQGKRTAFFGTNILSYPGDIITIPQYERQQSFWGAKPLIEEIFELYRKKHFPKKPSRLSGVFTCPIRKCRFQFNHKYTYEVELLGKTHYGDSHFIDDLADVVSSLYTYTDNEKEQLAEEYAKPYWEGKIRNKKNAEILSEKVKILRRVKLNIDVGDTIITTKTTNGVTVEYPNVNQFLKKNNIKLKNQNGQLLDIIVPKNTKLIVDYKTKNIQGKLKKITGYLSTDENKQFEIRLQEDNLFNHIKIV